MRTIIIGDVHGRTNWKETIRANPIDHYVFIGDYLDSFDILPIDQIKNLKEIIQTKQKFPERVTLLMGNHDIHYFYDYPGLTCSGFNPITGHLLEDMLLELGMGFTDLYKHFEWVKEIDGVVYTHAGVTDKWIENAINWIETSNWRDFELPEITIPNVINALCDNYGLTRENPINWVSQQSGGRNAFSGPLWARPEEFNDSNGKTNLGSRPVKNTIQVVGHTESSSPWVFNHIVNNTKVIYIDTSNRYYASIHDGKILKFYNSATHENTYTKELF